MLPFLNQRRGERVHVKRPACRVELHIHLDGAIRPETAWELSRQKGLRLPGSGSLEELKTACQVQVPKDLVHFLSGFQHFMPAFKGDLQAIERMAYEFCQDEALTGVLYVEARYCPHLLLPDKDFDEKERMKYLRSIVDAVNDGFRRGEIDFELKVRQILTVLKCIKTECDEIVKLAQEYKDNGVVGIDLAKLADNAEEELDLSDAVIQAFSEAKKLGIHRTVHAGELGSAEMVKKVMEVLHAERIGHGYRIVHDSKIYKLCLESQIHLECCPWSSMLTGAISMLHHEHPVATFASDGMNFSINSDDPTVTGTWLDDEYRLVRQWGLTEAHLTRANFNAARACFLPQKEKEDLLNQLGRCYGMI